MWIAAETISPMSVASTGFLGPARPSQHDAMRRRWTSATCYRSDVPSNQVYPLVKDRFKVSNGK